MPKANTGAKGQKPLASFFGGGDKKSAGKKVQNKIAKKQIMEESEVGEEVVDDDDDNDDDADAELEVSEEDDAPARSSKIDGKIESSTLPPLHHIPAMFSDLVSHIPQIKDVAEHVKGRKLRVATMCSGTESPLLALELICQSIKECYDITLEFQHVFSCEIEPFKQAYIERNFKPPLLFRDVCELGDLEATTAYGALAPVPGDVDLLVAGTSCVDYSNLNNEKKGIDGGGESGRTFHGMMSWVTNHRPPLVILENVCSAPWERVKDYFKRQNYSAEFLRVDTKKYYIPHTRTRVYLLAVDKQSSNMAAEWKNWVNTKLQRPASSTLDAFLLPSDDTRIHQAREKLVQDSGGISESRAGRIDWNRCESRHERARLDEALGPKRPLTNWEEAATCRMPDFAWQDWGVRQVERVWDLMDISLLRSAKNGIDPSYKTLVWNLSQNVDRSTGSGKAGICPCLTPSMIPYITNRGGPMVGVEALAMQGLPVDKLLLTRESQDELADLAGNAMSSTVVGACILAALVVGKRLLKAGDDTETYETKKLGTVEADAKDEDEMDVDAAPASSIEDRICGLEQLGERQLDLSATKKDSVKAVLDHATRSVRLCLCEGRKDITNRELLRCADCGSSSCKKCAGRPEHNFEPLDVLAISRVPPGSFIRDLKSVLPMCLSITSVTEKLLDDLKSASKISIPEKRWGSWRSAVLRATSLELRFVEPKRQEVWSAVYQSASASFELYLDPKQTEWRLYATPLESEPANAEIRQLLQLPVARFKCKGDFMQGRWQFALPYNGEVAITMTGTGTLVPSWESRIGLQGDEFKEARVHSHLKITVPKDKIPLLDRDISGTYALLDKCGTACEGLHKRETTPNDSELPPLFMMLDPTRCGDAKEDAFVFTSTIRRFDYGEFRPIVCKLAASWRQSDVQGDRSVNCRVPILWVTSDVVSLKASQLSDAHYAVPRSSLEVGVTGDACARAVALLSCNVPLLDDAGPEWSRGEWREVDKVNERATFRSLAWLLERIRHVDDSFSKWQTADLPDELCHCQRCAPTPPTIKWSRTGKKIMAIEDSKEAGQYERDLKLRPSPFVTQLRMDQNVGAVKIGLNIASLLHRAMSRLPSENRPERPSLTWRLDTDFTPSVKIQLPPLTLKSNRSDPERKQPPNFELDLRKEQLRSLTWMLQREAIDAAPFIEEEISEAILEPLGWRAEGRAQRAVKVRGGVLADQVGYGKTAITLGLIDCSYAKVRKEVASKGDIVGKVPVKATLVVVPPHLTRQWRSEAQKFAPERFKEIVIISTASQINSLTVKDVQDADLVIVASNLFQSTVYLANLEAFAAGGTLPSQDGRYFNARLDICLEALRTQVERLKEHGSVSAMKAIRAARRQEEESEAEFFVAPKRLKGKSYVVAVEKEQAVNNKPKPKTEQERFPAKPTPSGMTPEVVISTLPPKKRKVEETDDTSDGEDVAITARRPKRQSSSKSIILDSDDDAVDDEGSDYEDAGLEAEEEPLPSDDEDLASVRKRGKPTPPATSSSENEESLMRSTSVEETSEDEEQPRNTKRKDKGKAQAKDTKARGKGKASSLESDDDSMDVDEPPSSPSSGKSGSKKRKVASTKEAPAKKQKRREDTDPWHLESPSVKRDWKQMRSPPLEMFHFARVVVDEYTYLTGKVHSMVTKLTADRRWVLSGTPPIHDFGAVKTIAAHLGLHLGIDDDGEGQSAMIKKRIREQTKVEAFHSFREVHTQEWHAHRHRLGQVFLDTFVRQNIAEIDEIPCSSEVQRVILPAAERAIYLELEHHLRALDMTIKRTKKTESDREKRLNNALGDSKTAEEALLKRCSHFDLDTSEDNDKENAMKACEIIVKDRTKQLDECKEELLSELKESAKREKKLGKLNEESMFQEYARVTRLEGVGDHEATEMLRSLLNNAEVPVLAPDYWKNKHKGKDENLSNSTKDLIWAHREKTHNIRKLTKELVGRVRSRRYFTVVRDLQKQRKEPPKISCTGCGRDEIPMDEVAVLSSCGHTGCMTCVKQCADREECVYAASGKCTAAARVLNIVKGETLGVDDEARDGRGRHFGKKLEMAIDLIKNKIPNKERVLIFVQFPDLMVKVANALKIHKIKFLEIRGSATQKSKNLEKYQQEGEERVLLLNVMDESASGANLTSANHAIFLSPLLAPTQEIYNACETQAVGRLRRYGQDKHVNIWAFLTLDTIDVEIYEQRTKTKI
ncbi:hypothetical protein BU15DRAFT_73858 [Melanogaster broomeanus]|nr:hypothetical protein BU15DRAFT_73858 [Melanogaster broomeanus]